MKMKEKSKPEQKLETSWRLLWLVCCGVGVFMSDTVLAASGMDMGWDGALCSFATALTGKTAIAVGTIAFSAAGAGAIWGEQMTGIMKTMTNTVVGVGVMMGGAALINGVATAMSMPVVKC